jgi:hypothetical protein
MSLDDVVCKLPVSDWAAPLIADVTQAAVGAIEAGHVVVLPTLRFKTTPTEESLLSADILSGRRKNISFDPATGRVGGASAESDQLAGMLKRFADSAQTLARVLLPDYGDQLRPGRTSFRPAEIAGRDYTPRKDDRRLHVDAFPTRPMHGDRILRLFTNIAPDGRTREWRIGEPFPDLAARFLPMLPAPARTRARLYAMLGLTKGVRSGYDQTMLALHDRMKLDEDYQRTVPFVPWSFPPGTTWLCFTDQVSHAALAGHFALEQTFYLPVTAMAAPDKAPVRVLERLMGRALV